MPDTTAFVPKEPGYYFAHCINTNERMMVQVLPIVGGGLRVYRIGAVSGAPLSNFSDFSPRITEPRPAPLQFCRASRGDGECVDPQCPQAKKYESTCPLPRRTGDDDEPPPAPDAKRLALEKLLHRACDEPLRLQSLSVPLLIHEAIDAGICESAIGEELMRRVDPDWLKRYDENGNPKADSGLPRWEAK